MPQALDYNLLFIVLFKYTFVKIPVYVHFYRIVIMYNFIIGIFLVYQYLNRHMLFNLLNSSFLILK